MTDELKKIIGKNIKKYRDLHNETSVQLAESIGSSQSTVSDWENGKKMPRAGSIEKLAQHWKIPKSKLLNEPKPTNSNLDTIAAHIDDDVTEEEMRDIMKYIDFVKSQRDGKNE